MCINCLHVYLEKTKSPQKRQPALFLAGGCNCIGKGGQGTSLACSFLLVTCWGLSRGYGGRSPAARSSRHARLPSLQLPVRAFPWSIVVPCPAHPAPGAHPAHGTSPVVAGRGWRGVPWPLWWQQNQPGERKSSRQLLSAVPGARPPRGRQPRGAKHRACRSPLPSSVALVARSSSGKASSKVS